MAHRQPDFVDRAVDNLLGPFRLRLGDGDRPEGQTSVADLIPVVLGIDEPVVSGVV